MFLRKRTALVFILCFKLQTPPRDSSQAQHNARCSCRLHVHHSSSLLFPGRQGCQIDQAIVHLSWFALDRV
jgi:hypothetical protein